MRLGRFGGAASRYSQILLTSLLFLPFAGGMQANAQSIWVGGVSVDWSNGANWSLGSVPNPGVSVTLPGAGNLYNFNVTTPGVGTFGQVGAGMKFDLLKSDWQAYVRGDALFGAGLTGQSVNIGLYKQF